MNLVAFLHCFQCHFIGSALRRCRCHWCRFLASIPDYLFFLLIFALEIPNIVPLRPNHLGILVVTNINSNNASLRLNHRHHTILTLQVVKVIHFADLTLYKSVLLDQKDAHPILRHFICFLHPVTLLSFVAHFHKGSVKSDEVVRRVQV